MFKQGDIVTFKNQVGKSYRQANYVVTSINKGNGKVWVRFIKSYTFWKLSPKDLIKVGHTN